jgi:type IV secretory pathway VirB4 component
MYPQFKNYYRGINSTSLAAVFPFTETITLDKNGYMLGHNSMPVMLDIWKWRYDTTQKFNNANGFIVGTSGSGKSFFMKLLASYLYADNVKLFILDPENEYAELVHNFNGKFIDVGTAVNGRINPFHIYSMLTETGENASSEATFSSHLNLLESFFKIILVGISSDTFIELNNLIVKAYALKKINHTTDITTLKATDYPIFDDLYTVILNELKVAGLSNVRKHNLDLCESYIKQFTQGERNSSLWNGASTLEASEDLVVFNFQSLFMSKNNVNANAQMLLVMRFLEQQITGIRDHNRNCSEADRLKSLIAVDEGYLFVNNDYPIALDFMYSMFKRARKYDLSMLFTTQNLSDLTGNQNIISKSTAIISNSQYSFIFKLKPNEMGVLNEVYNGRINEVEEEEIINAQKGQCFLIQSEKQRTSFQVVAPEIIQDYFENNKDNVSVESEYDNICEEIVKALSKENEAV